MLYNSVLILFSLDFFPVFLNVIFYTFFESFEETWSVVQFLDVFTSVDHALGQIWAFFIELWDVKKIVIPASRLVCLELMIFWRKSNLRHVNLLKPFHWDSRSIIYFYKVPSNHFESPPRNRSRLEIPMRLYGVFLLLIFEFFTDKADELIFIME